MFSGVVLVLVRVCLYLKSGLGATASVSPSASTEVAVLTSCRTVSDLVQDAFEGACVASVLRAPPVLVQVLVVLAPTFRASAKIDGSDAEERIAQHLNC